MPKKPDKLIVNSPFVEPKQHWKYIRESRTFELTEGRRPAGYVQATEGSKSFDDPGNFIPIELVNKIRPRVIKWRTAGYPGVTGITKRLLEHWSEPRQTGERQFFFCQLEAIETLIWLTEAPPNERVGIEIPSDGGDFSRWCSKMATGSGKTIIMAMIVAWHGLNKTANKQDARFSKNFLIVAPGLTVKSRLQVLNPSDINNYYEAFDIVPADLRERLRQCKVLIVNWHLLEWDSEEQIKKKRSVDKRGAKSDEAYVREVLGEMSRSENIVVINDEAHHAWRVRPDLKVKRENKEDIAEATIWVGGLDRIHRTKGILQCFDLSATPFAPSGKKSEEEALYSWIVSDFGLNDAIESGLVKTPRVVMRDDSRVDEEMRSRLYHIYNSEDVKENLNRPAEETEPLPDLIKNAYLLLGKDWLETKHEWEKAGHTVPPVMITVANRTETAARIKYSFDKKYFEPGELCIPEKTLRIDSKILAEAEELESELSVEIASEEGEEEAPQRKESKKDVAIRLRRTVDTIGQKNQLGEKIQNVISVGMLTEGWDAKTVTHIMGLRAFSSQLLCEQVVGRGLRRTSYEVGEDGLYEAEYVNIFGVPFTFMPHEDTEGVPPAPPKFKTEIKPLAEKVEHEIRWPNIDRIDHIYKTVLSLDWDKVEPLELDPYEVITHAELAAMVEGKPNAATLTDIDIRDLADKYRMQSIVFKITQQIYNNEQQRWKGTKEVLLAQVFRIVDEFVSSDKLVIKNDLFSKDRLRKRILVMLNMNRVVNHIWQHIRDGNTEHLEPVFNTEHPIRSTASMASWYTSKPCHPTEKSHINFAVVDSGWESTIEYILDHNETVESFVKNDHLGFVIYYSYLGATHRYFPDFIVRFKNSKYLVLEVKGEKTDESLAKHAALKNWIEAVNINGSFGQWSADVSYHPSDLEGILEK
jgi:type III restriction enzyme